MNRTAFLEAGRKLRKWIAQLFCMTGRPPRKAENMLSRKEEHRAAPSQAPSPSRPAKERKWLSIHNEELWTRLD
jgi:hypothetical protein